MATRLISSGTTGPSGKQIGKVREWAAKSSPAAGANEILKWKVEVGIASGLHSGGASRYVFVPFADAATSRAAEVIAAKQNKMSQSEVKARARVYADGTEKAL